MQLFEHVNDLFMNKSDLPEHELATYDPYMINRCVSMSDIFLPVAEELNKRTIPKQSHARLLKNVLPDYKVYLPYIKTKKRDEKDIKMISEFFQLGSVDAEMLLEKLQPETIKKIKTYYAT